MTFTDLGMTAAEWQALPGETRRRLAQQAGWLHRDLSDDDSHTQLAEDITAQDDMDHYRRIKSDWHGVARKEAASGSIVAPRPWHDSQSEPATTAARPPGAGQSMTPGAQAQRRRRERLRQQETTAA